MLSHSTSIRLAAKVRPDSSGCWLWIAGKNVYGYGAFWMDGQMRPAHRVTYENRYGLISDGLEIDHLCRVRACCNPAHLEPVTQQENIRRGEGISVVNARKTHCKRGHPFDTENTYVRPAGKRNCRTCRRERDAERPRTEVLVYLVGDLDAGTVEAGL